MFLAPQHYQLADQYAAQTWQRDIDWTHAYGWGLRSIEIDAEALTNHRFHVRQLRARMPGGQVLSVPEDLTLPVLDLRPQLQNQSSVKVFLSLPLWQKARANASETADDIDARFVVSNLEVPDENNGTEMRTVQVRQLNARLLTSLEDHAGFETLPIAQVRRSHRSTAVPEIDPTYIPPVLACDAWEPLQARVLERLSEHLGRKRSVLQSQAVSRSLGFDSTGQGERLHLEQLRVLNSVASKLSVGVRAVGIHPLLAYRELASIVGQLAIFSKSHELPTLPAYEHDDLAGCFLKVRDLIEMQLDDVAEPHYELRHFQADGTTLRVGLSPDWLENPHLLLVGVRSSMETGEVEQLLSSGRLLKLGAASRVDNLYLQGAAGIKLRLVEHPPRALPLTENVSYYALERENAAGEWREVVQSKSLAVRFGEQFVVDRLPDGHTMVVDHLGRNCTLAMSLFVMPQAKPGPLSQFGFEASTVAVPVSV